MDAMPQPNRPYGGTTCVGCGRLAVKFCKGWNGSVGPTTEYGRFAIKVQCGMPVCRKCNHDKCRAAGYK